MIKLKRVSDGKIFVGKIITKIFHFPYGNESIECFCYYDSDRNYWDTMGLNTQSNSTANFVPVD